MSSSEAEGNLVIGEEGEPAVLVSGIEKMYRVFEHPQDRLKQPLSYRKAELFNWFASKIGSKRSLQSVQYYKEVWALKRVDFSVARGETIGIIGTNGSGKSTLLQILCSTLQPSSGSMVIRGRVAALLELGSGFDPEFSGRQNVYLNAAIYGLTRLEIEEKFEEIAAFADIGDFMERPVKTYSSGMYVRLAFAVIAHVDADILVIDEALAVGDMFFTQKCMRFLRDFKEHGTIIFVSHDTSTVVNFCDRAVWLNDGEVKGVGKAKDICENYLAGQFARVQNVNLNDDLNDGELEDQANSMATLDTVETISTSSSNERIDRRLAYLNEAGLRNDIEMFNFDSTRKGFGTGGASLTDARLVDVSGREITWAVGGEKVFFKLEAVTRVPIEKVIMGFFVKDRLGQVLFGDNTYISYAREPVSVEEGKTVKASFGFRMPILTPGSYSFDVAVADGTQQDHVQLMWVHDAIIMESHTSSHSVGLVGVVMEEVALAVN